MRRTIHAIVALGTLITITSLAQAADPLPEFYGVYAVDKGQLFELNESVGNKEFSPQVRFIWFDRAAALQAPVAYLQRHQLVRLVSKPSKPVDALTDPRTTTFAVTRSAYWREGGSKIELRTKPVPGQAEMLMFVPQQSIPGGAYQLYIGRNNFPRGRVFFLDRTNFMKAVESTGECVDEEFSAYGLDFYTQQARGHGQYIPCVESTLKEGTYCGPGSKRPGPCGATEPGATGRASGNSQPAQASAPAATSNEPLESATGAAGPVVDGAQSVVSSATQAPGDLAGQLEALVQRQPGAPSEPEKTYMRQDGSISFVYPASWELMEHQGVLVATIAQPGEGLALSDRAQITLTRSRAKPGETLEGIVASTIDGTRKTLANAIIAGPVKTQMAGADAQVFFVTGTEAGKFRQKAVTVALSEGKVGGSVVHATPDTFESVWDAYVRVKNSYKVE